MSTSKKSGNYYDEEKVRSFVLEYQISGSMQSLEQVVTNVRPLIRSIIRLYRFNSMEDEDDLEMECIIKLHRILPTYDPEIATTFTLFSLAFKRHLISHSKKIRNRRNRIGSFPDDQSADDFAAEAAVKQEISDEFKFRIASIQTRFSEARYRDAIRFVINAILLDGELESKKRMREILSLQFGLSPDRADFICDYATVSLRSVLLEDYRPNFSDPDVLGAVERWNILPEIARSIGLDSWRKLMSLCAGMTISFPSAEDIEKIKKTVSALQRSESCLVEASSMCGRALEGMRVGDEEFSPLYRSP